MPFKEEMVGLFTLSVFWYDRFVLDWLCGANSLNLMC